MINRMRLTAIALVLGLGVLTSGCISIEQEIFLQPDGSGELLLLISLPDLPPNLAEDAKGGMSGGDPAETLQKFKTEVAQKMPPTIKLKEAKELKRNGTLGFYALFQFKDLNDVQSVMANVMKESAQGLPNGGQKPPEWTVKAEQRGGLTNFTQLFFADISDTKVETGDNVQVEVKSQSQPATGRTTARAGRPAANSTGGRATARAGRVPTRQTATPPPEPSASGELKMEGMEGLAQMMLGVIRFRFVLHTPAPITNSNADLVLNGKTALWNCSLAAFAKEKKPIEMKASF